MSFQQIVDEAAGRLVAKVTAAVPITSEQEERLIQQLSAYSGKQVRLETTTDAQIQGGVIVQLDDTVFDASVASQIPTPEATTRAWFIVIGCQLSVIS